MRSLSAAIICVLAGSCSGGNAPSNVTEQPPVGTHDAAQDAAVDAAEAARDARVELDAAVALDAAPSEAGSNLMQTDGRVAIESGTVEAAVLLEPARKVRFRVRAPSDRTIYLVDMGTACTPLGIQAREPPRSVGLLAAVSCPPCGACPVLSPEVNRLRPLAAGTQVTIEWKAEELSFERTQVACQDGGPATTPYTRPVVRNLTPGRYAATFGYYRDLPQDCASDGTCDPPLATTPSNDAYAPRCTSALTASVEFSLGAADADVEITLP